MERAEARHTDMQERMLLLVGHGGAPIPGRDWLQFEMYLIYEWYGDPARDAYYVPGPTGPYSAIVNDSLEALLREGLVAEVAGFLFITLMGEKAAAGLEARKDEDIMECVDEFKDFASSFTRDELPCYVCRAHPGLTADSPERKRIVADTDEIIMGMVWKGRIGLSMAGGLTGKGVEDMMRRLKRRGYNLHPE